VHLLNATAFETHIMDIYNQMDVMDESLLPKRWRIEKEFCTHKQSEYWTRVNGVAKRNTHYSINGYKQQEVFKKRLALVYLGRSTQDVGFDKPNIYKIYEVEATDDMKALIKKGHRYQEVLNCPSLIKDSGISMNRKEVPKLDRLCSLVEREFVNDKIMVYCFNIEAQSAIQRELEAIGKKSVILNGETDEETRYQIQKRFNDGEYDVVITNIKKSINLNGADVAIFYSIETNPAKMFQIASRIDRHTDDRTKTFVMLIYKDTNEYEYFTSVVKDRAKNAREIILDAKTTADFIFEAMGL
jgi:superfamily II DNA or RNA helicase